MGGAIQPPMSGAPLGGARRPMPPQMGGQQQLGGPQMGGQPNLAMLLQFMQRRGGMPQNGQSPPMRRY